ncbi:PTS fructose-like transporter subunit EIIB [Gilliamella sp. Pra-s65]|uniref:fructose PTS transporter subunit IIB n=1 Tax=unclassified Gilliamella TaxID=2685620 RepID=UPI001365415E|nr:MULTISPECIES: fructose PTS transporter subunit IIB [unclassified Gilliamella]MWN89496.1 PTS fructose-like transporter subunit EIIB [Gilliamella sp. Pra-s65]MWP46354.1 PTS fructose-like transporter subunit EIIB [Gilliamella sp. Pas-s27]MWP72504.1 PTS fructose-like transporter subunit EIIB [Gilliamella sp. Pra-s52]
MVKLNVVAITACISGVAHTYMAAERLARLAKQKNWTIKIETQGALGIDNEITSDNIQHADLVIIISNVNIKNRDRFTMCRCIEMDISRFLIDNSELLDSIKRVAKAPYGTCIKL